MRWFLGFILLLVASLYGGYHYVKGIPYAKYTNWIQGKGYDQYFDIQGYRPLLLAPVEIENIPSYQEDYVQLWKVFPLGHTLIPMPTRHPLFQSVPIIELSSKTIEPNLGIAFSDPGGREISRLYNMPKRLYQDHSQGQELFKLPFFRNRIRQKNLDQLWKDIFSLKIDIKNKIVDEMIYDLYILHLRAKILPKETIKYGLVREGKLAMIEMQSHDKDYMVELVMIQSSGTILSYVIKTEKNKPESLSLRAKFLNTISFGPRDEAIGRLLYTEFKQLNYARQVDQEGMLYLFSAWSQNTESQELMKEMIYYLERGQNSKKQLTTLYKYSFKKYGKTFTTRKDLEEQDDPELALQRNIELEERDRYKKAQESQLKAPAPAELSPDEKMNIYLKKAKEQKTKEAEEMTVH